MPTLLIAGIGFKILSNEQERINLSAIHALSQRASSVCETIHITIEAVQDNLEQALFEIDRYQLKTELTSWEKDNPLVRNFFIFQPKNRLYYPSRGMESTAEERRFISRYDSLFSGRIKFESLRVDFTESTMGGAEQFAMNEKQSPYQPQASSYSKPEQDKVKLKKEISSRKKLIELSRLSREKVMAVPEVSEDQAPARKYVRKSGWLPWFSENQLFLLGWVQKSEDAPYYGVELELMTLLSRLIIDFPIVSEPGVAMVLLDGNGNAMHQTGHFIDVKTEKPTVKVPVSDHLPHWQIAIFVNEKGFGAGNGFLYLSVLLLGIFVIAIVFGGLLLTRLTLSNIRDARLKTNFVSSVSHELKTPLTSIRMYAELLLSKRVKDETKTKSYLSVIVGESERLTRLINNVLDFGKLEQGKKRYDISQVNISDLLVTILDAHSIRIKEQGLEIITDFSSNVFEVATDRDAVEQVILNILDNSLKYAASGKFIKLLLFRDHQTIVLKICDDGPGIPKDQQKLIFSKFHRIDNSLTAKQPGSGLGLTIARQIMNDLGGDVSLEPIPKNGSCFVVYINEYQK